MKLVTALPLGPLGAAILIDRCLAFPLKVDDEAGLDQTMISEITGTTVLHRQPLISAFYFGDWHVDPQMSAAHGANWTEFELAINAHPRYAGHRQPNIPANAPAAGFGINQSEAVPAVMARKIDSAVTYGVDMWLFDWYWYASPTMAGIPDLQGPGGGPFLAAALQSFLKA